MLYLPISMTTTAPTAGSLSVLWVDDDHELAEGLADYLRGEGYLLSSALTLAEARQQLQDRAYDLVLVDLSFPRFGRNSGNFRKMSNKPLRLQGTFDVFGQDRKSTRLNYRH